MRVVVSWPMMLALVLVLASLPVGADAAQQGQGGAQVVAPRQPGAVGGVAKPGSAAADHQRIAEAACRYSYPQATAQQLKECARNYIAAHWGTGSPATNATRQSA